jgi:hypothetical protein
VEGPTISAGQVYLIADRPMTEEEWERQRAREPNDLT